MSEQTNGLQQAAGSFQKEGFQHTEEFCRLNKYQKAAVLDESPACVVNANVGSGKTTVLIGKILYLHLDRNVPLEKMTVLTFTNKAADEIVERLRKIKPDIAPDQVQGFGTFHSVALRMLKNSLPVEEAGWTKEFTVMDPDEETDLAMKIIQEHGLKVKYKNRLKKRLEQEYQNWLEGKAESRYRDDLYRLYPLLAEEKKRQNKMSFADLLRVGTELLRLKNAEPGENTVKRTVTGVAVRRGYLWMKCRTVMQCRLNFWKPCARAGKESLPHWVSGRSRRRFLLWEIRIRSYTAGGEQETICFT